MSPLSQSIRPISKCFKAEEQNLMKDPDGNEMIMILEKCLPILRLHQRSGVDPIYHKLVEGVKVVYLTRNLRSVKSVSGCTSWETKK